ncbi:hypothetical protein EJ05DRAFT_513790 [Pseudovirgaria hyperparasitica]|uniref:Uncharacterized protein n=1 Tax=Pseudovirgaria hyperparasitica TaxID=470096 RepID=A0A6A6VYQ5_9PEZI|nr:uncharacterized protein EJ05DRAFT_513790 [Pseudovirgaria hyperparasitica]KAF2754874.1 hypothetical protein EJ05DRAFT_513790 [Pseudovirgaria hyperparasitica]
MLPWCILLMAVVPVVADPLATTYAIHSSCSPYPAVLQAVTEAIKMASLASQHLEAEDDWEKYDTFGLGAAFRLVWNIADRDDYEVALDQVSTIFGSIAETRPGDSFSGADIHIYCDNDERWKLAKDRTALGPLMQGDPAPLPNSREHPDQQIWVDNTSGVYHIGIPACFYDTTAVTYTKAIRSPFHSRPPARRAAITICNDGLKRYSTLDGYIDIKTGIDLSKIGVGAVSVFLSHTILHELTHTLPYEVNDDEDNPYGWEHSIQKHTDAALDNADNYAYFGALALLFEKGYMLTPDAIGAEMGVLVQRPRERNLSPV